MTEIRVEKKSKGIPWWVWLLGAIGLLALIFALTRLGGDRDDKAARAAPEQGAPVVGTGVAPAPVAITGASACKDDNGCAEKELCFDGACQAITASTAACSAASVKFRTDSADVDAQQKTSFDRLARCLRADRSMKLTIEGSADPRGAAGHNDLAEKRAHAVARELSSRGVSAAQLNVVSYGENRLLCAENDEACWAKNRRTELQPSKK